jgi:uncharacterized protein
MNQQTLECPRCKGTMRTYDRNGVHIEQCDNCRGIFLDYGELESLSRLEAQWAQPPPPAPPPAPGAPTPPAWGQPQQGYGGHEGGYYGGHRKRGGFGRMLFSS